MIGRTIGHYHITEKIGEGGMGTVYLAEDTTLNRPVALKRLSAHLSDNEEARKRFFREAQAASTLNHPNITTVHEFLEDAGEQYICMEYIEGETLKDKSEAGRIPIQDAVEIILQVAKALREAHDRGILHRDIKSANIMVKPDGTTKVMDFGLAYLEEQSQLTRTGTTLGTLSYSSPEQITGLPLDHRSDLYSLGVVFYELLTGELPFRGTTEAETLYNVINTEPGKLSTLRVDIPDALEAVIEQMLKKDPGSRYIDCSQLIEDLQSLRERFITTSAVVATTAELIRAKEKRKTFIIRAIAGISLAGVISIAILLLGDPDRKLDPYTVITAAFQNNTGDESLDYLKAQFGNRIHEEISSATFDEQIIPIPYQDIRNLQQDLEVRSPGRGTHRRLRTLARRQHAGTVIHGNYSSTGSQGIRITVTIYDFFADRTISHIAPVTGDLSNEEDLLSALSDRVKAAVGTYFDPLIGELMADMNIPRSWDSFLQWQIGRGYSFSDLPDRWSIGLPYLIEAATLDTLFIYAHMLAAFSQINLGDYSRAQEIMNAVNEARIDMKFFDDLYIKHGLAHLRGDRATKYSLALEGVERSPNWFWAGAIAIDALGNRKPRAAYKYMRRYLKKSALFKNKVDSRWPGIWRQQAYSLHIRGKYRRELKEARMGLEEHRDELYLVEAEIRALIALNRITEAREKLNLIRSLRPDGRHDPVSVMMRLVCEMWEHGHERVTDSVLQDIIGILNDYPADQKESWVECRSVLARAKYYLALINDDSEKLNEAKQLYEERVVENPQDINSWGYLGTIAIKEGQSQEAQRIDSILAGISIPRLNGRNTYLRARIAARRGDIEKAVGLLHQASSEGTYSGMLTMRDPDLEPLRGYRAFEEWVRPRG